MNNNIVILVDENDKKIGLMDKIEAHQKGLLHRAVSVFIINSNGEWLLQQRALEKYHSPALWTNTACTHPHPDETNIAAAKRRLLEEMGISAQLQEIFSFIYKDQLDENMTEHELDHVFIGISDDSPNLNKNEVVDYAYIKYEDLVKDVNLYPEKYTTWFKRIFKKVNDHYKLMNR